MRKDSGFEVMDHIKVSLNGNDKLSEIVKANESSIATKVLANEVVYGSNVANAKEQEISSETRHRNFLLRDLIKILLLNNFRRPVVPPPPPIRPNYGYPPQMNNNFMPPPPRPRYY